MPGLCSAPPHPQKSQYHQLSSAKRRRRRGGEGAGEEGERRDLIEGKRTLLMNNMERKKEEANSHSKTNQKHICDDFQVTRQHAYSRGSCADVSKTLCMYSLIQAVGGGGFPRLCPAVCLPHCRGATDMAAVFIKIPSAWRLFHLFGPMCWLMFVQICFASVRLSSSMV